VYVRGLSIEENYFGPEVLSSTPYSSNNANSSEYMGNAITLETPNTSGWFYPMNSTTSFIVSNRIDRTFRGITIDGMFDTPLAVSANSLYIEDDMTFSQPAKGYGIFVTNNVDNFSARNNTLEANPWHSGAVNPSISLVYCENNFGGPSPVIECNKVRGSQMGFEFVGSNSGTVWEGNEMCEHWAGMALRNNGVIGQQGSPTAGMGNFWSSGGTCPPWGQAQAQYQTYCENSNPNLSTLFVMSSPPGWEPISNFSFGGPPYGIGNGVDTSPMSNRLNDCIAQNLYQPVPSWRQGTVSVPQTEDTDDLQSVKVYPNPTSGILTLSYSKGSTFEFSILDVFGRTLLSSQSESQVTDVDLTSLPAGVYFLTLKDRSGTIGATKLIKTD
jgi:hypothetical protein